MMLTADERAARLQSLIPILQCPRCRGNMNLVGAELVSQGCGARYPVRDGVPVLIPEGMEELGEGAVGEADRVSRHPYSPASEELIEEFKHGWVLDLGAGGKHLRYRNVVQVDVFRYPATDVVASADTLPFRSEVFDAVLSQAVFEHLQYPEEASAEIYRVLKPKGIAKIDTAFLQPEHGYPHHYFNATEMGLRHWFREFELEWSGIETYQHPKWALSWFLDVYLDQIKGTHREILGAMSFDVFMGVMRRLAVSESLSEDMPMVRALDQLGLAEVRALAAGVSIRASKPEAIGQQRQSAKIVDGVAVRTAELVLERRLQKYAAEREHMYSQTAQAVQRAASLAELRVLASDRSRYLTQYLPGTDTADHLGWLRWFYKSAAGFVRHALPRRVWFALRDLYKTRSVSLASKPRARQADVVFIAVPDSPLAVADQFFSMVRQTHANWHLVLVEHPHQSPAVRRVIADVAMFDQRVSLIQLTVLPNTSLVALAMEQCHGEFVVELKPCTVMAFCAVEELITLARHHPPVDAVYADFERWCPHSSHAVRCHSLLPSDLTNPLVDALITVTHHVMYRASWVEQHGGPSAAVAKTAHVPAVLFRDVLGLPQ